MNIITVINAKGGCGKSTIAMNLAAGLAGRGYQTLLLDMDPQAQLTQWLAAGDGLSIEATLVAAMTGLQRFAEVIRPTVFKHLSFVASTEQLEELGRQITEYEGYAGILSGLLAQSGGVTAGVPAFDFVVIDSPNQISPVMENAILPADLFVVPFESAKAIRSYANFYKLLLKLRPDDNGEEGGGGPRMLHVLNNVRYVQLKRYMAALMEREGLALARTEIRTCPFLAQVDEHGGSIFAYRPASRGAEDMNELVQEVMETLGMAQPVLAVAPSAAVSSAAAPDTISAAEADGQPTASPRVDLHTNNEQEQTI
ncbi:MAG TPA: ParA family protein [Tepidisphaeraceae bacterium]|jgi:chromosome partitioning protein